MNFNDLDNRRNYYTRNQTNKTYYQLPNDMGVTFGSIAENFRIWFTQQEMHGIIDHFEHTYITDEFTGTKEFYFTEGMLLRVGKPNLSLSYNIEHSHEFENQHASLRSMEAVNVLKAGQFTSPIIQANDGENSIDVRLAFRPIKMTVGVGIVCQSRHNANNIIYAWNTRRQDNLKYTTKYLIDWKIPNNIIEFLYNKFKINRTNHRPMLKWLNRNCRYTVYYGLDGFNAKPAFFIKIAVRPLYSPNGLSSPVGVAEGNAKATMWTITRNYEIDILVPSLIAVQGYVHHDFTYDNSRTLDDDIIKSLENIQNHKIEEYTYVINDKHAIAQFDLTLSDDDIVKLSNGKKISNKIDLKQVLDGDVQGLYYNWGLKKGLQIDDMFDFVVNKYEYQGATFTRLGKGHTLEEAVSKLGLEVSEYKNLTNKEGMKLESEDGRFFTVDDIDIPEELAEYDNYIKNNREFWFVDLEPENGKNYNIVLYMSIHLFNQFILETNFEREEYIHQDDDAHEFPQGMAGHYKLNTKKILPY